MSKIPKFFIYNEQKNTKCNTKAMVIKPQGLTSKLIKLGHQYSVSLCILNEFYLDDTNKRNKMKIYPDLNVCNHSMIWHVPLALC